MTNKDKLNEKLNKEIIEFRKSFESMSPSDVYREWYKIMFFEEYYQLLTSDYIDKHDDVINWLYQFNIPLHFLYEKWLRCDSVSNGDWDEMIDWLTILCEEGN